jgi:SecD/SecF fusion protein
LSGGKELPSNLRAGGSVYFADCIEDARRRKPTLRSKSYLFLLLVLGLGILSGFLYWKTQFNYGLDVRGGIRLTYELDISEEQRPRAEELRQRLITVLHSRAAGPLGVGEPVMLPKGEDQLIVELPGATDIETARQVIGTSAQIEFYHARNVTTERAQFRPYSILNEDRDGIPVVRFMRTANPDVVLDPDSPETREEYAAMISGWTPILAGEELASAAMSPAGTGFQPRMNFSRSGADKMFEWSKRFYNQREHLASVLDGRVISIAPLQDNTTLRDHAVITGTFPETYVRQLVDLLNGGALPVELDELAYEKIDPTIGAFALERIVLGGMIAFGFIALFLLVYYAFPGLVALVALLLYVLFTLTVLKLINATFSLAAIAGFILSVGMAVDANILVFERLKEEMKSGKPLMAAIDLGFKRAFPAILDSNICTILTSLVLLTLGTGPVKGFATTLIVGVAISFFTAVTITRSLLIFSAGSGLATNPKWYALKRNWFGEGFEDRANEKPFQIVNKPKKWFLLSAIIMVIGLPFFFFGGFKLNVEFQGGTEISVPLEPATLTGAQIARNLTQAGYTGANVKLGEVAEGGRRAIITLPAQERLDQAGNPVADVAQAAGLAVPPEELVSITGIGPAVQAETVRNAILAIVISSALIVIFLGFRFGMGFGGFKAGLRFGTAAIGALIHDVVVVFGTAALVGYFFGWEISALFITAMLTVIGFSVHDSIVIFDRIRENLHRQRHAEDFGHLVNRSITQSFARSINTSATTALMLLILLVWGTTIPDLRFFILTMLVGILIGTFSSIYNAAPILYLLDRRIAKKHGEEHSLPGMAVAELARARMLTTNVDMPTTPTIAPTDSPTTGASGRTYGQVRRRANDPKKGYDIED